ncbi:MAG: VanW family protein [Lachnospiraceae bacterium]|nr:VanW family protein [Lachnospiraceae bacterium]
MHKNLRILPLFAVLLAACLLVFSASDQTEAANRIPDGVFLGDTDLSGMTMSEAADAMNAYYEEVSKSDLSIDVREIPAEDLSRLEAGEKVDINQYDVLYTVTVPISEFGFDYSIEEALRYASTLGQTGKLIERYKLLMDMKYASAQLPLSYTIDGEKVRDYVEKTFVPENTKDPVDAKFTISEIGVHVSQKEEPGIRVNADLTVNSILQAFSDTLSEKMTCNAVVAAVPPEVSAGDIENVTFSPVASYTTKLWAHVNGANAESNWNRSRNIFRAADLVNGTVVMPGKQMSLNRTIGQRTEARGFFSSHAYSGGRIIDQVGGGICQFATTFYNVLLLTEMQIDVRYAHSMLVDYVPYSMDATLDWESGKDVVWTNIWDTPIYIRATWKDNGTAASTVTVTFYGKDPRPANRKVEYRSVTDFDEKPAPTYTLDSSRAPGQATINDEVLNEVSSHLDKIVRVNGSIVSTETVSKDYYRPLRATITVGTRGLSISAKWDSNAEIYKLYDGDGNQLLMNYQGLPYYNGNGGYRLCKDYQHNANGYSTSSTPVPVSGGTQPTQPATTEPSTEQTQPSTEQTQPSTEQTQPSTEQTQPSTEQTQPSTEQTQPSTEQTQPSTECQHDGTTHDNVITSPTCGSEGLKEIVCDKCNKVIRTEKIPATGQHDWTNWTADNDATHSRKCNTCGATEGPFNHAFGDNGENAECSICHHPNPNPNAGNSGGNEGGETNP